MTKNNRLRILHLAINANYENNPITRAMRNFANVIEVDWERELQKLHMFNQPLFWDSMVELIDTFKPHIVFMQIGPEIVKREIIEKFRQKSFVIHWTGDVRNDITWIRELADAVSLTLFTNMTDVTEFRALGYASDYLQVGYDEKIYTPEGETDDKFEKIVFLGNNYVDHPTLKFPLSEYRVEMVNYLKQELGDHFAVYGSGWGIDVKMLSPEEEALCYRSCIAAINLSHYTRPRYTSDRIFRIMATGALCLTHSYPEMEREFIDKEHLLVWDNLDILVGECKNLIEKQDGSFGKNMRKIAHQGMMMVHKRCSWEHRMGQLLSMVIKIDPAIATANDNWIDSLNSIPAEKHFSQYGDESYIRHIFQSIGTTNKYFVEFGAGDGIFLSNTRYLKETLGWEGLQMDWDNKENEEVKKEFITKDNICELLEKYGVPVGFDFLSIDMDGNDFYVLHEILKKYSPRVIIAEFNGTIPEKEARTIQYNEKHEWNNDDYYGMSLEAVRLLADRFGYLLFFQTMNTNCYLIKRGELANPEMQMEVRYTPTQYHKHNELGLWKDVSDFNFKLEESN